jgi:hypothetical protein
MATASEIKLTEVYIGLLGRAPDPAGLAYWVDAYEKAVAKGGNPDVVLKKIMNDFTLGSEWDTGLGQYGTETTVDGVTTISYTKADADNIVNGLYENLFEKTTQSDVDVKYWSDQLQSGKVTASEMAVMMILGAGPTDTQVLGFKTEAATYYVETISADDFNRTEAKAAVNAVEGPQGVATSKAATDKIASGTGNDYVLTTSDDTDTLVMSGGDDTVTGTLGVGATYDRTGATDDIVDNSTNDADVLTINSTDALVTTAGTVVMGTVTNVETVNVNFNSQLGTVQSLDLAKVSSGTNVNVDVNPFVTVAGIDNVAGATTVAITNSSQNIVATDVTTLSVDMDDTVNNDTAFTITADADATVVSVGDIDDGGVTLTLGNDSSTNVLLSGGDGTNDSVTISANNAVALNLADANDAGTQDVDLVSLSGNTNDVNFTITNASSDAKYTVTGSKDVTLTGTAAMFTTNSLTDNSTGTITVDVTGAGAVNLSDFNADVVDLSADAAAAVTFNDSQAVTISNAQTDLTLVQNNGNDGEVTVTLDMGAATSIANLDVVATKFAKVSVSAGDVTVSAGEFDGSSDNTDFTLVGTNDITFDGAINSGTGDVTVSGKKLDLTTLITGASVDIDATNDVLLDGVTATGGVDIVAAGTFANATAAIAGGAGAGNDVAITAVTVASATAVTGDDITIEATNDTTASVLGSTLTAGNDVNLNGGNLDITGNVTATAGNITITAGDVDMAADLIATKGNITISGGDVAATDFAAAEGVLTVTGTAGVVVSGTTTAIGGVVITSANDVDLGTLAGETNVINGGAASGKLTVTTNGGGAAGNVTLVSGSGNDVLGLAGGDVHTVNSGDGADTVTITAVGAQSVINTGGGADIVNAADVTDAITLGTGDGNDTINVTHGGGAATAIDGGDGTDTVALATGDYKGTTLSFTNIEVIDLGGGNSTINATQLAGDNTFEITGSAAGRVLTVIDTSTAANAAIDMSNVTFDIGAVATTVLTGGAEANVITGSDSIDVITGLAGNDTINGGEGADNIDGGTGIDTINGGAGIDTIEFTDVRLAVDADIVNGFVVGTDIIGLEAGNTIDGTNAGAAAVVEDEATAAANANNTVYNLDGALAGTTNDVDLVTLDTAVLTNIANADLSAATDGTELLKALVVAGAGNTASAIDITGNASVYLLTDDGTDGYLYYANDVDGDGLFQADEIILVGTFDGALMDGVVAAQTIMV